MGQIIWTRTALDDIDLIAEYVSRDSESAAATLIVNLFDSVERLATFPNSGRIVPEVNKDTMREVFYRSYRIMCQIDEDAIHIVRIVHGARNWQP